MKNELTKKRFFTGLIAGIVMIALLAGLEIAEPKKATGQAAGTAAETTVSEGAPTAEAAATAAPAEPANASVSADTEGTFTAGTYTGSANGFGGPVEVTLTVGDAGGITNAEITGSSETPDIGGKAIPTLAQQLLDAQSAEICLPWKSTAYPAQPSPPRQSGMRRRRLSERLPAWRPWRLRRRRATTSLSRALTPAAPPASAVRWT